MLIKNMEKFEYQPKETNNKENFEKKESIKKIEKSSLSPDNKIDLILLFLNKKRAAFLGDFDIAESEEHKEKLIKEFNEELNSIGLLLNSINLPYEITRKIEDDNDVIGFSFTIAGNQDDLNKIKEAEKNKDDRTMGLLLGYPETAVSAYCTKDALDIHTEIPKEEYDALRKEGMLPFLEFSPSKLHWKEELDWARNNKKIIEENSPNTFKEAIEDTEKYINNIKNGRK